MKVQISGKIAELLRHARENERTSSVSLAEKTFSGEQEAEAVFAALKEKITNIDEWNRHGAMTSFKLFDEHGNSAAHEKIAAGKFIRIALSASGKYDWVRVGDVHAAAHEFVITVRPTYDPTPKTPDKSVISHFFTDESTNNFCLLHESARVRFFVIGLDEKQNADETKNALEIVRNAAVNLGSLLGIQKAEWETFCARFLEDAGK